MVPPGWNPSEWHRGEQNEVDDCMDVKGSLSTGQPTGSRPKSIVLAAHAVFLDQTSQLRRLPRAPGRSRPSSFHENFEDRCLYYDAFWYGGQGQILLVGPPPLNLGPALDAASYRALPCGTNLSARLFASRSTMITELEGAPWGTEAIEVTIGNEIYEVSVGRDFSTDLSDAQILFAINKNNDLAWIARWADWHVKNHGTDTAIVFDNGSTRYGLEDLKETLRSTAGLARAIVFSMPQKFGPLDKWVLTHHFWPRFLQISAVNIALRRFGMKAKGLINCDIDELVYSGDVSAYQLASESNWGVLRMRGQWIEAVYDGPAPRDHLGYFYRHNGMRAKLSPPKFVLDPSRDWVRDLGVHPYLHRVHFAPSGARRYSGKAVFWHFRGINTNWKEDRTSNHIIDPKRHRRDEAWCRAAAKYIPIS